MGKTILTERQKQLLKLLGTQSYIQVNYYLTGGTALAEYYLHHRYSEDLDFFTEKEADTMALNIILRNIQKKAGIKDIDFQQSFNRNLFFLHFDKEIIKTEFTYYPFPQLEKPKTIKGLKIDSLIDITVNKLFTIYQNPRSRDFIDLYLIIKEKGWALDDIRKKARIKFDTHIEPLQLTQQLLKVRTLKDYPRMIKIIGTEELQKFWLNEAQKIKSEVIE